MLRQEQKYKHCLSNKMTIYFSAMLILVAVFFIVFYYRRTIENINHEAVISMENRLENQSEMFNVFLESFDQLSLNFRADEKFMNILNSSNCDTDDLLYLQKQLRNFFAVQKNIKDVQLYIPNLELVIGLNLHTGKSYTESDMKLEDSSFYDYYETSMQSKKYRAVFADYSEEGKVKQSFYYTRVLLNVQDQSPLGILLIHFNQKFHQSLITDNLGNDTEFSGVFDQFNSLILTNSNTYYEDKHAFLSELLEKDPDENGYVVYSDHQNFALVKSEGGMKYMLISSKQELQKENTETVCQSIGLLILIVIIFIIVIRGISNSITKPIVQLADQMKMIDIDNPTVNLERKQDDEILYLTNQFKGMLQKMDALIEEKYISTINENNARMKALQAQINPHFLYNSLQVISTQAMLSDNWKIVEMVDALSNTYRYSVKVGDIVTIMQEKGNLENYLSINKYRYEEQLVYTIAIAENVEEFVVPKFTFQILAENAIKHGMGEHTLYLRLEAKKEAEKIILRAVDNGKGFHEEKRRKLIESIKRNHFEYSESHGLGLKNLYDRFSSMYGSENIDIKLVTKKQQTIVEYVVTLIDDGRKSDE